MDPSRLTTTWRLAKVCTTEPIHSHQRAKMVRIIWPNGRRKVTFLLCLSELRRWEKLAWKEQSGQGDNSKLLGNLNYFTTLIWLLKILLKIYKIYGIENQWIKEKNIRLPPYIRRHFTFLLQLLPSPATAVTISSLQNCAIRWGWENK